MTRHFSRLAAAFLIAAAAAFPARAEIDIQVVTSPGGITAWLYEEHSIPILDIEAAFTGGAAIDGEGAEGAVYLMTALLNEGAGDLDATGFAEAAEALAAMPYLRATHRSGDVTLFEVIRGRGGEAHDDA